MENFTFYSPTLFAFGRGEAANTGALEQLGAKTEDIPAMVSHRAEKPNGFPFGKFVPIGRQEMAAILHLAAADVPC